MYICYCFLLLLSPRAKNIQDSENILLYYTVNWDGHENWSAPRPHQDK